MLSIVNYTSYNIKNINNMELKPYSANVSLLKPLSQDTVSFSGKRNLLKEYGINPDEVEVVSQASVNIDKKTKTLLLEKVVEAYEHAAKNKELGNFSGRFFATNMMFENGKWAVSTNMENTAENGFCGERSALVRTWNQSLEKLSLKKLKTDNTYKEKAQQGLKARYLAMSSFNLPGEDTGAGSPCSDCLNWLNETRYFSPKAQIATIEKNPESGKYTLRMRNIKEVLPYWGENAVSTTDKSIKELKIEKTDKAQKFMAENNISEEALQKLLQEAKKVSENARTTELSDKNTAAAALFSNGKIESSEKMDWTRRWFISPDLVAITKGLQKKSTPEATKVLAVAYYGNDKTPYIDSLGRISQDRGTGNTLVLTVQNDEIKARTIYDYMPYLYISSKKPVSKP